MSTQLEESYVITWRWWRTDKNEINPKHVDELRTLAEARIRAMHYQGCVAGVLHAEVQKDVYTGWWETSEVDAQLIKAASTLREALQGMAEAFGHYCEGDPSDDEVAAFVRAQKLLMDTQNDNEI